MNERLIPEWLLDNGSMDDAIDEAIRHYIWKQKVAYGIEYTEAELKIDPAIFRDSIQKWLDECYSENVTFENENVATEYWLEDEGYDLIQKAIEA